MKRLLTSTALFLCSLLTFAQFSGSGSGTENDPYLILNPIQLNQLRNFLNQSGVYFKLMADIDLTEFIEDEYGSQGWKPVGTSFYPFRGILDGNGKTISGLWINRSTEDYVGLFSYVSGVTIKDLKIKADIYGANYVGAIAGRDEESNTFSNITIEGTICGNSYVGGLVGYVDYTYHVNNDFSDITAIVSIKAYGNYVGGLVGYTYTARTGMSNCQVINSTITGKDYIGGLCGEGSRFDNCFFSGIIEGNSNVGGISGTDGSVKKSCVIGEIIALNDNIGGITGSVCREGITGSACWEVEDSYFCGKISGGNNVGGIIGWANEIYCDVTNCYVKAKIIGKNKVGGICGYCSGGHFSSSAYLGNYLCATEKNVGRICGEGEYAEEMGTPRENKALNRTIVVESGVAKDVIDDKLNGAGVSATTLKLKATYVAMGWDFTDTWEIQETECYPYFKTQTAPPVITSQVISGATTVSGKCVDGGTVTLEIDGVKQQMVSTGNTFSFTVSPLQAGHEVRVSAKTDGKEQSYYTTEVVSFLGKGKESDPYQISTAADLTQVYRKGYYKLMNDIDLTDYINQFSPIEGWQSIGRDGSETIHFDGDGHKVSGLWCNSTRDNTGLFSCFANGTIKNLTVETAEGKQVKGGNNTGILIGKMINGTVEQCRVSGNVSDGTPVGGMIGLMDNGTIQKSLSSATINTTGENSYVGGLVGEITAGEITECVSTGLLTATGINSYVGGLVGKNSAIVSNSYSLANVTSSYNAAGLVAYNFGTVDKCYATGNLYSNNYAAGVIGYSDGDNAIIKNCAAMNNRIDVTYESQQTQQGGGYGQRIIGGIKNGAPAPEMNNYALKTMQVSLNAVPQKVYDDIMNGVSKDMDDLKTTAPYLTLGWDFYSVWSIEPGVSYPFLLTFGNIYSQTAEPTGIMLNERSISGSNTIHNMIGQRVQKTGKGIFIINKKKVFVN